jgi:hypothetical protein
MWHCGSYIQGSWDNLIRFIVKTSLYEEQRIYRYSLMTELLKNFWCYIRYTSHEDLICLFEKRSCFSYVSILECSDVVFSLGITKFRDFAYRLAFWKNTVFRKLDLCPSSGENVKSHPDWHCTMALTLYDVYPRISLSEIISEPIEGFSRNLVWLLHLYEPS